MYRSLYQSISFLGLRNKFAQTSWPKRREIFFQLLGVRSLKPKCGQHYAPSEGYQKESFSALPLILKWLPVSASAVTWYSPHVPVCV